MHFATTCSLRFSGLFPAFFRMRNVNSPFCAFIFLTAVYTPCALALRLWPVFFCDLAFPAVLWFPRAVYLFSFFDFRLAFVDLSIALPLAFSSSPAVATVDLLPVLFLPFPATLAALANSQRFSSITAFFTQSLTVSWCFLCIFGKCGD